MPIIVKPDKDNFRDRISIMEEDGSRKWIFAKKPKGKFYNKRTIATVLYLLILFGLPLIQYKGEPLLMFNVVQRKFIIFGLHFGSQDAIVFGLAMLTGVVFIVLFTVIFGRVFCGWACPQTIFMEMVFRKIEYWIDGDMQQQRNLAKSAWTPEKIRKRALKYIIFFLISFLIANTFLAYIIGLPELTKIVTEPVSQHIVGLIALLVFTGVFFTVFVFLREQICIVACPYGRLQGVMLDRNSIVVAYDYVRGEPRGKLKKETPSELGDCIDCKACVHVCPTGIDIRNGTQLECVNCTACIDACDDIMHKINKPLGLIRYASENDIEKGLKPKFSGRILAYTIVLLALLTLLVFTFVNHSVVDASILRTPGQFYQENPDGTISNLYNFKVANKTNVPMDIKFELSHKVGSIKVIGNGEIKVEAGGSKQGQLFIIMPQDVQMEKKQKLEIKLLNNGNEIEKVSTTFMAPISN